MSAAVILFNAEIAAVITPSEVVTIVVILFKSLDVKFEDLRINDLSSLNRFPSINVPHVIKVGYLPSVAGVAYE